MQVWAIVVDSFREVIDRKLFWIMIVVSVALAAALACVGFDEKGVNVLFGMWRFDSEAWSLGGEDLKGNVGALMVRVLADFYLGWVGMIAALISTAGMIPAFLESGRIDLELSKPISRHALLLGKYLGAMVFVLLQATAFVVLSFLAMGLRWGVWLPGFLWVIPLMVLMFSYLYGFCALFGVLTRGATSALLLTMLAWIVIWTPQETYEFLVTWEEQVDPDREWQRRVKAVKWLVPKTQDIPLIAGKLVGASLMSEVAGDEDEGYDSEEDRRMMAAARKAERRLAEVNPVLSIGSSLAFELGLVGITLAVFRRRDF
jgi:ABC-type transport system involved in multi-copper enzyme maturation permease subunit